MRTLKRTALALAVSLGAVAHVAAPLAVPLEAAHAGPDKGDKPPKAKDVRKLAGELCVGAMAAGGFEGREAAELGAYCVELAMVIAYADYEPEPAP
jgi:hypothetical protein